MSKSKTAVLVPIEHIAQSILILRGQRVLLDNELAALYGVTTKRFNERVKRNLDRFPVDFMFQLSADETSALRSQSATLKTGRGQHRKYLPYVCRQFLPFGEKLLDVATDFHHLLACNTIFPPDVRA